MGEHHGLRTPGGARGVGQEQQVIEADRFADRMIRRLGHERLVIDRPLERAADDEPVPYRGRRRRLHHVVLDQDDRFGLRENERSLIRPETVVHRRQHGSELAHREQRLEEGGVVRPQPRDPVTTRDAEAAKAVGQAPDPFGQFGVRERSGAGDQGRVIRRDPGPPLDPRADPEVSRRDVAHRVRMTDQVRGANEGAAGVLAGSEPTCGRAFCRLERRYEAAIVSATCSGSQAAPSSVPSPACHPRWRPTKYSPGTGEAPSR